MKFSFQGKNLFWSGARISFELNLCLQIYKYIHRYESKQQGRISFWGCEPKFSSLHITPHHCVGRLRMWWMQWKEPKWRNPPAQNYTDNKMVSWRKLCSSNSLKQTIESFFAWFCVRSKIIRVVTVSSFILFHLEFKSLRRTWMLNNWECNPCGNWVEFTSVKCAAVSVKSTEHSRSNYDISSSDSLHFSRPNVWKSSLQVTTYMLFDLVDEFLIWPNDYIWAIISFGMHNSLFAN